MNPLLTILCISVKIYPTIFGTFEDPAAKAMGNAHPLAVSVQIFIEKWTELFLKRKKKFMPPEQVQREYGHG